MGLLRVNTADGVAIGTIITVMFAVFVLDHAIMKRQKK